MGNLKNKNAFVDRFSSHLDTFGQAKVLDVGCGLGDSAIRLAQSGHIVMGISNDHGDIASAKRRARRSGLIGCTFEAIDAREIDVAFEKGLFNAVLISDMLHLLEKEDSQKVLGSAKALTSARGINGIWGYLVDPTQSQSAQNIGRMLSPNELHRAYSDNGNWTIEEYAEEPFRAAIFDGKELVSSHAGIIAKKV